MAIEDDIQELKDIIASIKADNAALKARVVQVENFASDHLGIDWGTSGLDINSPHPNLSVDTIITGGDHIKQDSTGFSMWATDGGSALGLPPDATRVKWVRDSFIGDEIGDIVAGYFTPSIFDYNEMFLRAFPGADGGNVMAGIWDKGGTEDWLAAMFINYISNVPSWAIGTTVEAWLQLSQVDASNYTLKILKNGVLTEIGSSLKTANTGQYLIPTTGTGGAVRSGSGVGGSWSPVGVTDISAPSAPTATTNSANVAMPASVAANDLLLVACATVTTTPSTPSGWTQLGTGNNGVTARITIFAKKADGTEGGTSVTFTNADVSHVFKIPAAQWDYQGGVSGIAISTIATAAGQPNPSAVSPVGGAGRFIAFAFGAENYTVSSPSTAHAAYSGFTENHNAGATVALVSAYQTGLNSNTEDPGAFSGGSVTQSASFAVAVNSNADAAEALYITGLDVAVSGTPGYVRVTLGTGTIGAESVIGVYKLNTADPTLEFSAVIPVASGTRIVARIATDTGAANHNLTLHAINQDDTA